jgi:hypothetical protein
MRTLVRINGHTGYVDIPTENDAPNPYVPNAPNLRNKYLLEMEITESPDWEAGRVVGMLFTRDQVEILEVS